MGKPLLRVYNTLSRKIEKFKPHEKQKVRMFTCGPSVYRRPHIGNYRTFLYEDLLQRYLEYLGYDVVRLISLTDIEDKAIVEAQKEEVTTKELAERNRRIFTEDAKLLRMKGPTYAACMMACSSTAVEETAKLIKALLNEGYAYYYTYGSRRNVYFDPLKFAGFGRLSMLDMDRWPKKKRRFHRDTYVGTRWNRGDFILWHGYKKGDADHWDTEIGKGRPSWNIQDAATITKYLGYSVDVACGGIDNLARHHDYTIAIVESVSGQELAHYWFHGQHLFVDGKKMSKSKGNVFYPDDLVRMGYSGDHIRFFLISGHYRKRLNFTLEKMRRTSWKLDVFRNMVHGLEKAESEETHWKAKKLIGDLGTVFESSMNSDLDVKAALDALFSIVQKLDHLARRKKLRSEDACTAIDKLRTIDSVFQVIFESKERLSSIA
jgi:cysteinyl-tRNA synthetase